MVVGGHAVFPAEHIVCTAVIAHIHQDKQIVATDAGLNHAFAVSGGKAGAFDRNQKGILLPSAVAGPFLQMRVDFPAELLRTRQRDDVERRHPVLQIENRLTGNLVRQFQRLLFGPRFSPCGPVPAYTAAL